MKRFGFPKQARLLHARDFDRVNAGGRRLIAHPLRVRALRRPEGGSRLGLAVSRRVGRAHLRNRWKRAIREAFRLNRHRLQRPYDLVVSVAWDASPEQIAAVGEAFLQIIERLNADDGQADGAAAGA